MRLSFIVPVYNSEKYITRCLDSLLEQDIDDYEIICINDGSKDNSLEILNSYATKFPGKFNIINQNNQGIGPARNNAFKEAKGDYTWFIDNDDCIKPNCLANLFEIINEKSPDIFDISYERCFFETNPLQQEKCPITYYECTSYAAMEFYFDAPWSKIYKTKFLQDCNVKFPNIFGEDTAITFDLYSKTDKIIKTDNKLYAWFEREDSFSNKVNTKKHFETFPIALEMLREQSTKADSKLTILYDAIIYKKAQDIIILFNNSKVSPELEDIRLEAIKKLSEIRDSIKPNIYISSYVANLKTMRETIDRHCMVREKYISEKFESSISWKITRPYRAFAFLIKKVLCK